MSKRHHPGDDCQSKTKKKRNNSIEPTEVVEGDSLECFLEHMQRPMYKNVKEAEKLLENLGWEKSEIQCTSPDEISDIQYTSPDGTIICDSLHQVYEYLTSIFGKFDFSSEKEENLVALVPHEQEAILPVPHEQENRAALVPYEHVHEEDDSEHITPIYCPEALTAWMERLSASKESKEGVSMSSVSLKAKQHLVAIGWKLKKALKSKGKSLTVLELRYFSPPPEEKCYYSLAKACKAVLYMQSQALNVQNTTVKVRVPSSASSSATSSSVASASFPPSRKSLSASIDAENAVDWQERLQQKIEDMKGNYLLYMEDINSIVSKQNFLPGIGEMCFEDIKAIHDEVTKKYKQFKEVWVSPQEPVSPQQQIQQPGDHLPSIQPQLQEQEQGADTTTAAEKEQGADTTTAAGLDH